MAINMAEPELNEDLNDTFTEEELREAVMTMAREKLDCLNDMWSHMFEPETRKGFLRRLKIHSCNYYNDLIQESKQKQEVMETDINSLIREAASLSQLLSKDVYIGERPENMPLVIWQVQLDETIGKLRSEVKERRAEICELLLQQEQLCDELGEPPRPLLADPLPKEQQIREFREHLDRWREERGRRMEELYELRTEVKRDMKILQLVPLTDAQERLLNQMDHKVTPETFNELRMMHKSFAEQVLELKQRIDDTRAKIEALWERLQETDEFIINKVRKATDYTQVTFDILKSELQRCQTLRRQDLKGFIEKLREQIEKYWDLTLKSEQERKRFSNFHNNWFNEDLLELHELELDDLKGHYDKNKEIFELYARRMELWMRMDALEAKANEPNRYNNRGGQLLKEERERKAITSKLPKIEQQIAELVQTYTQREHAPFLVNGENILQRMERDWADRRQAKEQQSSARKHSSYSKMPPPRTPMTLKNTTGMSTSTNSLRKTPKSQAPSSSSAKTTGNLSKRRLLDMAGDPGKKPQTPLAKRSLFAMLNSLKPSTDGGRKQSIGRKASMQQKNFKSPLKKVRVLANTLRRSSGMGRRSMKGSSKSRAKHPQPPHVRVEPPTSDESDYVNDENDAGAAEGHDETYEKFEKCIEPAARSSVLPSGGIRMQTRVNPRTNGTPCRLGRANQLNSNNNNNELDDEQKRLAILPKPRRMGVNSSTSSIAPLSPGGSKCKLATKDLPILF